MQFFVRLSTDVKEQPGKGVVSESDIQLSRSRGEELMPTRRLLRRSRRGTVLMAVACKAASRGLGCPSGCGTRRLSRLTSRLDPQAKHCLLVS